MHMVNNSMTLRSTSVISLILLLSSIFIFVQRYQDPGVKAFIRKTQQNPIGFHFIIIAKDTFILGMIFQQSLYHFIIINAISEQEYFRREQY